MLRIEKGYGAKKNIGWISGKKLVSCICETPVTPDWCDGVSDRKTGSGRRRIARTDGNASVVEELALSQKEAPGTHRTVRQIAREAGITKSSVHRIIHPSWPEVQVLQEKKSAGPDWS